MFHVELRESSSSLHRYNLDEQELRATLLEPWVRGEQIALGELTWDPALAQIVVLEGPEIPIGRMTMGRGWGVARREGTEVTARALAGARDALIERAAQAAEAGLAAAEAAGGAVPGAAAAGATAAIPAADASVLADALGLEILRGLGETPLSLPAAWRAAVARHPKISLGVALEIARGAVASLAGSNLVVVARAGERDGEPLPAGELATALDSLDSWTSESGPAALWIRRA